MDAKVSTKTKTKTFQNLNKNCPLSFNCYFKTILIHNMLKVSRQQQQKLPDCLSRENRLGKPSLHRSNFGGIRGRKNTGDFPKPFHLLWQNFEMGKDIHL